VDGAALGVAAGPDAPLTDSQNPNPNM